MAGRSDEGLAIARVYASAMLRLAEAQGEIDFLLAELQDIAARIGENGELATFLSSPTVDRETRRKVIEKLFRGKHSDLFVDSLQVLNRKGRLGLIQSVAEAYAVAREEHRGLVRVKVRTATPMTAELRAGLKQVAGRYTGKEADLVETLDESLIGGLVVQIGDEKFDGSVRTRLKRLGETLSNLASHEVFSGRMHVKGAAM